MMFEHLMTRQFVGCIRQNTSSVICRYSHSKRTHYEILNVKKNCSNEEIRKAFAKLSKLYHPDTSKTGNSELNSRKFQEIMESYRILNKKSARDAYDAQLSHGTNFDPNNTPYYGKPFRYGDYEMMRRYRAGEDYRYSSPYNRSYGPFRNKEQYDQWNSFSNFNRRRVFTFLFSFMLFNILSAYLFYMVGKQRNMMTKDFQAQYGNHRYGTHGVRYYTPVRYPNDQYMPPTENAK